VFDNVQGSSPPYLYSAIEDEASVSSRTLNVLRAILYRPSWRMDPLDEIHMISVGTGEPEYYAKPAPGDDGLLWWGDKLFEVASGATSQGVDFQWQYVLGPERYRRIDFKTPSIPWRLDEVHAVPELIH
jgi:hypothetical protein